MKRKAIVVGAGVGGLAAALFLARSGLQVEVLEARAEPGGLACGLDIEGLPFDAGPYILLDRPGLEWAFRRLGLALEETVRLLRLEAVYEVRSPRAPPVVLYASRERTAEELERAWPGSGRRYLRFLARLEVVYRRLLPLQWTARPGLLALARHGALRHAPFLMRPLQAVLERSGLPAPVQEALGVWTHVAGQRLAEAPSPLAFVPVLIHGPGAYFPQGGVGAIPRALSARAAAAGVRFRFRTRAVAIRREARRVRGVETDAGEFIPADAVVANASGLAAYLRLLKPPVASASARIARWPLQSPGVCAYLAVRGVPQPPYLRFLLPPGERCRLLIQPSLIDPSLERHGWHPARLVAPMDHAEAERGGASAQRSYLERLLAEGWWREAGRDVRVLHLRTPAEWGAEYNLYRDSMNPVMTAGLMRRGRLAHRSPHVRGLYLAGGSTHPGQWVSFCAISGVLAAQCLVEDLG